MYLVEVIPIARGISKEMLSYFTTEDIPLGSLVEVELRKKKIKALVISSEDAREAKAKIRAADFGLKKIEKLNHQTFLSPSFIKAVRLSAEYFACTTGAVLSAAIPKFVLDNEKMPSSSIPAVSPRLKSEKSILQNTNADRWSFYKSLVRESFAKKHSIFIMIPTHEDGLELKEVLGKGIENHILFFSSALSKRKLTDEWQKLENQNHPLLIIGTGSFLSILKDDVKTIVVEKESSSGYKIIARPFLDFRYLAESYSYERGVHFILADRYLRVETLGRHAEGELVELSPLRFQLENKEGISLIDMRKYRLSSGASFQVLSDEVKDKIAAIIEDGERMFIFSARRGLSPTTLCADCGTVVLCNNCGAPTTLHATKKTEKPSEGGNYFLCHHCGEKRSALEKCSNCGGWRLTSVGIGVEKVEEEIKKNFPAISIFRLDKETGKTPKKARDIVAKFHNTPGSILLGTEMAFLYQRKPIEYSVVATMDSLFSIPDFHINERVFHLLINIQDRTGKEALIQTRDPEQTALTQFAQGRFSEFYRQELKNREKFGYPPFKTLIKITLEGKQALVTKEMEVVKETFAEYQPFIFPAFVGLGRGNVAMNAVIKVNSRSWPNPDLLQKLLSLTPNFIVKVDPESLL